MFSNLNVHLTEIFNIGLGNTKNFSFQFSTAIFAKPIMIQIYYAKKKEIICAIILIDSRCQSCPSLNVKITSFKWNYLSILGEHGECCFKVPRLESVKWIKSKSPTARDTVKSLDESKWRETAQMFLWISKWRATLGISI